MTTPTPSQPARVPQVPVSGPGKPQTPTAAQVCARVQVALAKQRREIHGVPSDRSKSLGCEIPGPLVRQPQPAARLAAILHNAAMDLWDVATEQSEAQMWEEARAIASRILAACPS